jgi:hypothetical protein
MDYIEFEVGEAFEGVAIGWEVLALDRALQMVVEMVAANGGR